jgi:sulfoxide reductase heme-binding subunit YedZ
VPFQPLGFFALVILLLMAATSHDFWLANLSAPVWKSLHMLVYVAYALLVLHVAFGVLQAEVNPVYALATASGLALVLGLHVAAAFKEARTDRADDAAAADDGFVDACAVADILENRARIVCLSGERVAIFRYDGKLSAVSNVCQHQNGPLGEGKILNGCITCPWHGYQYLPDTGASPPPFVEKVPTFNVRVRNGRVLVHPKPNPPGERAAPALIESEPSHSPHEEALTPASKG